VQGARLVKAWGGAESVEAASTALARIEAVLPSELAARLDTILMYAPGFRMRAAERKMLDCLHMACATRRTVQFHYTRLNGGPMEQRTVRPLALYCWSGTWTLAAWCELRTDFRMFRLDHIAATADAGAPIRAKARAAVAGLSASGAGRDGPAEAGGARRIRRNAKRKA
jgi:predicted DNA-binding transcriptional regulator YafY